MELSITFPGEAPAPGPGTHLEPLAQLTAEVSACLFNSQPSPESPEFKCKDTEKSARVCQNEKWTDSHSVKQDYHAWP